MFNLFSRQSWQTLTILRYILVPVHHAHSISVSAFANSPHTSPTPEVSKPNRPTNTPPTPNKIQIDEMHRADERRKMILEDGWKLNLSWRRRGWRGRLGLKRRRNGKRRSGLSVSVSPGYGRTEK
jgi:hypothetical protein